MPLRAQTWQLEDEDMRAQHQPEVDAPQLVAKSGEPVMMQAMNPAGDTAASTEAPAALGALQAEDGTTTTGATAASTVSPLVLGAGAIGLTALLATSSSGGSHGNNHGSQQPGGQDSLQSKPPQTIEPNQGQNAQGGGSEAAPPNTPEGNQPSLPGSDTDKNDSTPRSDDNPVDMPLAQANGPADEPHVSPDGYTRLNAESFQLTLANGQVADFVQITNIFARHGDNESTSRLVRYGDDDGKPLDANAFHQRIELKGPNDGATSTGNTAYEVYKLPNQGTVTLAQAREMAKQFGGKLLSIDDAREAEWLSRIFLNQLQEDKAWFDNHHAKPGVNVIERVTPPYNGALLSFSEEVGADTPLFAFVIEYPNYQHPLMLIKDGKLVPVSEGDIITKADFDKLVWQGNTSRSASISLSAVDSADPATAKELTRTSDTGEEVPVVGTIKLIDDASVQAPANPGHKPGEAEPPTEHHDHHGSDDSGHNGHSESADDQAQNGQTNPGNGKQPPATNGTTPDQQEKPDAPGTSDNPNMAQPDQDSGNAADTNDSDLPPLDVPFYENTQTVSMAHDAESTRIDAALFRGDNPKVPAQFIEILEILGTPQPTGPSSAGVSPSVDDASESGPQAAPEGALTKSGQPLKVGDKVAAADFDKISWNAQHTEGPALIRFKPVADLDGTDIPGAKRHVIHIYEHRAAPTYGENAPLKVAHDQPDAPIAFERVLGTGEAATHVKITAINDDSTVSDTPSNVLKFGSEGIGVKIGQVLTADEVKTLQWDASHSDGGSFSFVSVTGFAKSNTHLGATPQTIRIEELAGSSSDTIVDAEPDKSSPRTQVTEGSPATAQQDDTTSISPKAFADIDELIQLPTPLF